MAITLPRPVKPVLIMLGVVALLLGYWTYAGRECGSPVFVSPWPGPSFSEADVFWQIATEPEVRQSLGDATNAGIESIAVSTHENVLGRIFDDDPTYQLTIVYWVDYIGSGERYQWQSWRYGRVLCPFLVIGGDGPPGQVIRLQ